MAIKRIVETDVYCDICGEWIAGWKHYSAKGKVEASRISRYAAENPYETFAEGFLAMEKGETIPEQIAKIINDAKNRACTKK